MAQSEHRGRENLRGGESLSTQRRRRKKRRTSAGTVLFWLVIMIALSCSLAVFVLHSANDIFGLNKADQQYEITIEEGLSPHQIAQILADKGVIDQPLTFRFYSSVRNRNGVFQAGRYVLNSNMSYDQIVIALRTGNTIKEEVTLTFYEGMSASGIAKMLEEKKVCKAEEFLERLKTVEFGYEFENMLPESSLRFRRLEGYLFPDTYDFYVGEKVDSVLKKFMSNFQIRVFPKLYNEILDAGMTLDEAITLASIVQKEAGDPKEMARVSSVFHNRMSNTSAGLPMLQSDVTIFYVEEDIKPYQSRSTQDIYDAYNTYVRHGLPIGPICSPGIDAIRAAIAPENSKYYFFVTDINGKYYYSTMLDEHRANVRKAKSVGGTEHGTDIS